MALLERSTHLAHLHRRLEEVRTSGHGRLVLLGGEAGAGKTSLVHEFCAEVVAERSATTYEGGCEPLSTPRPLGPLLDIALTAGGRLAELARERPSAADLVDGLRQSLTDLHVLVLEDLHWADEATLDAVRLLGRRVQHLPALVLATYRDDQLEPTHPVRLALGELPPALVDRLTVAPLSREAVVQLAGTTGVDPTELHARTGGNAFFVTELLAAGGTATTPRTVWDTVLARAARVPEAARRLLEAVAVVPARAEVWLLEQTAGADLAALDGCLASGMLRVDGDAVAFRHEISRTTLEQALSPHRRRDLHRATLAALTGRGEPARLAHHAQATGDRDLVLLHTRAAARRATELGAHREAAAHLETALSHADDLSATERAALLEERSRACFLAAQLSDAMDSGRAALELYRQVGDRLREGDSHRWLARLSWYLGDAKGQQSQLARAIEVLQALEPSRELATAYVMAAARPMFDFDLAGTRAWGQRAIDLAEDLGETEVLATGLIHVGTAEVAHGLPQGRERLERAVRLAEARGSRELVALGLCNLATVPLQSRDYATAEPYLEAGSAYCHDHDLRSWGTYTDGWRARSLLDRGRWEEAEAVAHQVEGETRTALPLSRFGALLVLGLLRARRGQSGAWSLLDEAAEIGARTGELQRLAPLAIARAEACWLTDRHDEVDHETTRALALARAVGHDWICGELLVWRHRVGLRDDPVDDLPTPLREELAGGVTSAAAAWRALDCPYDEALVLAQSDVEQDLRASHGALIGLGARATAALVARRLRASGVRQVPRGPGATTRAHPAGLTARQVEVLAHLGRGARNADIARALFLSEKTVDHHVSAVLAKLGVSTRAQAVAEAARLGLLTEP